MWTRLVILACVVSATFTAPAYGQAAPTVKVEPDVIEAGGTGTVVGAAFEPGTVQIFVDQVAGAPLAEQVHDGEFEFLVSFAGVPVGAHRLIACNDRSRSSECRQSAFDSFEIERPPSPTTTTLPPRTTTTTRPTTTTIAPTTTRPPSATTTPIDASTTTDNSAVTTMSGATTTSPPVATVSPTTLGQIGTVTTVGSIVTTPPVLAGIDPLGPDPTFDPNPDQLAIPTTTAGPSLAGNGPGQAPDLSIVAIEVSQGIQNMNSTMPLVADRTTVIRVHVASEGQLPWGPVDGLLLLQAPG